MLLSLLTSVISAEDSSPVAQPAIKVFDPPFILSELSFVQKIIFSILLGILIFVSVIPKPEYKNYQVSLLNGAALWFGVVEIFIPKAFKKSPLIAVIAIAIGIILTLRKETKGFVSSAAAIYPTSLLLFVILSPALNSIVGLLLRIVICVSVLFLLAPVEPVLDTFILGVYNAFFAASIFEIFGLPAIFTSTSLHEYAALLHIKEWVSKIVVIILLLTFFFLPTALKILKSFIYKDDGKIQKEESV